MTMAANSHPHALLYLFILLVIPQSYSQSNSPQNIQTFYPSSPPPVLHQPPPPPPPVNDPPPTTSTPTLPPPSPPPHRSSTRAAVGRAIGVTVASTLVLSGLLFFFLLRYSRRRREDNVANGEANPVVPPQNDNFTRFNGNVKGVIVDENGLDVLYWKDLQEGVNRSSFKRQHYRSFKDDQKEEERRIVSERERKNYKATVQETPLLRGKSSTSQSPIWVEREYQMIEKAPSLSKPPAPQLLPVVAVGAVSKDKTAAAPPSPPPPPRISNKDLAPPPPPHRIPNKDAAPPPPPGGGALSMRPSPPVPNKGSSSHGECSSSSGNGQVKLKPLHWDKVNANAEHSMVWDKIDKGSFKFDGDLMEALFGSVATNRKSPKKDGRSMREKSGLPSKIFILDIRKSQNTAIVLKSLGVSRKEIIDALIDGQGLNGDTMEKLTKIAPTDEESSQILTFDGDPTRLADAESFIYDILRAVPSAFSRLNAMLFKLNYISEVSNIKEYLQSLESACKELRTQGLFLKLLEAVLKAGNRLNAGTARGNAQAFNLTALRKLSDVKSSDGKTTLLQFVVQEVIRAEGKRCVLNKDRSLSRTSSNGGAQDNPVSKDDREREYMMLGLPVIGGLSAEFSNIKKAAALDYDLLMKSTSGLAAQVVELRRVVMQCGNEGGFVNEMKGFLDTAELEIKAVKEEQIRVMEVVKKTTDYYQAGSSKDKRANHLQLFVIVRDFLEMVDQVCIDIARDVQKRRPSSSLAGSSPESPRVFRFPKLPANFMSESSKSSSSDSDNGSDER